MDQITNNVRRNNWIAMIQDQKHLTEIIKTLSISGTDFFIQPETGLYLMAQIRQYRFITMKMMNTLTKSKTEENDHG